MKVLIVDDAVDLNNVIQKILINQNYEADCAYDGKTGLRKALSNEYDIILLNIMMHQMNEYEVLKILRKEGRETPVILITAKDEITDRIDGLDFGAEENVLLKAIERLQKILKYIGSRAAVIFIKGVGYKLCY